MTRYQALRRLCGCGPVTAGFIALLNWVFNVSDGVIVFGPVEVEYPHD